MTENPKTLGQIAQDAYNDFDGAGEELDEMSWEAAASAVVAAFRAGRGINRKPDMVLREFRRQTGEEGDRYRHVQMGYELVPATNDKLGYGGHGPHGEQCWGGNDREAPYALTDQKVSALEVAIRREGYRIMIDPDGKITLEKRCVACDDSGGVGENYPERGGAEMPCPVCCSPILQDGTHSIAEAFTPDRERAQ